MGIVADKVYIGQRSQSMTFKPFNQKSYEALMNTQNPPPELATLLALIGDTLKEHGKFVGIYPHGAISYRDADGNLWEIAIAKSDVKLAKGEI